MTQNLASTCAPDAAPTRSQSAETLALASLLPIVEIERFAVKVMADMGLGDATASTDVKHALAQVDFSVLHFIILPKCSAWLDLMLETDRASALKIFEMFGGTPDCADTDLEDVLRETMNLLHGNLKVAFKESGQDVIIPVVPQSIASHKLTGATGGCSLQSRHVIICDGIKLRLTMIARVAPVIRKKLNNVRLAEVLVEPIGVGPDGDEQVAVVKKHTMLNKRILAKLWDMAEFAPEDETHATIEPSVLAELLPNN